MINKTVQRAHQLVSMALGRGLLVRPSTCEICRCKAHRNDTGYLVNDLMVAHHYAGYEKENALKVWWVCPQCNRRLQGYHDGSLTKEQARELVRNFCKPPTPKPQPQRCKYELAPGLKCMAHIGKSQDQYCRHHRETQP